MKYILIALILSACNSDSDTLKTNKEACFKSGGSEYYQSQFSAGSGSYCVYKNNSCSLDNK